MLICVNVSFRMYLSIIWYTIYIIATHLPITPYNCHCNESIWCEGGNLVVRTWNWKTIGKLGWFFTEIFAGKHRLSTRKSGKLSPLTGHQGCWDSSIITKHSAWPLGSLVLIQAVYDIGFSRHKEKTTMHHVWAHIYKYICMGTYIYIYLFIIWYIIYIWYMYR